MAGRHLKGMFNEGSLQKMLAIMNNHLPTNRRYLVELMEEENPEYLGKDGVRYRMDKAEIALIASLLDPLEKARLRLPILISTDTQGDAGLWKVSGKVEARLVARLLDREPDSEEEVRFYFPHLNELRRKLPTTTVVMYMP